MFTLMFLYIHKSAEFKILTVIDASDKTTVVVHISCTLLIKTFLLYFTVDDMLINFFM
jgi:hypothetical protein